VESDYKTVLPHQKVDVYLKRLNHAIKCHDIKFALRMEEIHAKFLSDILKGRDH
jgi:hypothetical protein